MAFGATVTVLSNWVTHLRLQVVIELLNKFSAHTAEICNSLWLQHWAWYTRERIASCVRLHATPCCGNVRDTISFGTKQAWDKAVLYRRVVPFWLSVPHNPA